MTTTDERMDKFRHDMETLIGISRSDIHKAAVSIRNAMDDKDDYPIEVVEKATA